MSYCAICGRQHDPQIPCFDGVTQILEDIDAGPRKVSSKEEYKNIAKAADKYLLKILLWVLLWALMLTMLGLVISSLIRKGG